jgi:hypothetical protein
MASSRAVNRGQSPSDQAMTGADAAAWWMAAILLSFIRLSYRVLTTIQAEKSGCALHKKKS